MSTKYAAILNSTDSLTLVLSGAAATTEPTYSAMWYEGGTERQAVGSTNGATAVTPVSAPAAGQQKLVKSIAVYNGDTAAVTVTLAKVVGGTSYTLASLTLQVGDTLTYNELGVRVVDSSGQARIIRTGYTTQIRGPGKVGGTSGWVLGGANDLPYIATMAASQSAGTLVIPLGNLHIGDTITAFKIIAQVESAGGAVTIDAALRAVTNVAAEPTDASIGAITQVSVTADTAVAASKSGLTEVVTSGKSYYLLITATTAGSTDIILQHCEITVTTA